MARKTCQVRKLFKSFSAFMTQLCNVFNGHVNIELLQTCKALFNSSPFDNCSKSFHALSVIN